MYAGLILGLMGSLHCIGMCGPLLAQIHAKKRILFQIYHHSGRILAYLILGSITGVLGQSMHWFVSQQVLSILIGSLMILYGIFNSYWNSHSNIFISKLLNKIPTYFFQNRDHDGFSKHFIYGLGNGFLPCGLVYTAAAASISEGHLRDSVLFMFGFGIGTIPSLMSFVYLFKKVSSNVLTAFEFIYKYIVIIVGVLLILRGLGLNIPYISPALNPETNEVHGCCHKSS